VFKTDCYHVLYMSRTMLRKISGIKYIFFHWDFFDLNEKVYDVV